MSEPYSNNIFAEILKEMNRSGNFSLSVLFDKEGFTVATAGEYQKDTDRQSATLAVLRKSIGQAKDSVGLNNTQETVIVDEFGQRLVCRFFLLNQQPMTLAVVVPDKNQPFRKLMNAAIRKICESLS